MAYIGTSPSNGVRRKYKYTATAGQQTFTGNDDNGIAVSYVDTEYLDVYQNGVKLVAVSDYASTTGTSVVLVQAASVSDIIEIIVFDVFSVADTVSAGSGGSFGGNIGIGGTLSVSGDIIKSTSGTSNFVAGVNAGNSIASGGNHNVLVGDEAGTALTTGDDNVAIGFEALKTEDAHGQNVAVGYQALKIQNAGANGINTAVGYAAGTAVTTGTDNTLIGGLCGDAITDGNTNTAMGSFALTTNQRGDRNTAIGHEALKVMNPSGDADTYNTAVGYQSGIATNTGANNTLIGGRAGDSITTGSNNINIGFDTDSGGDANNTITIGINIAGADNDFSFGKASNVVSNDFDADANWSRSSDVRLKKNITNQTLGLDFINDLRTVKYNWKPNHELDSTDSQLAHLYKKEEADNEMNTTVTMHNFIAQEVKTALDTAGVSDFAGWKEDQYGVQQVSREMFVIPLVKAIQELSAKNDALEARIKKLEG